MCQKLYFYKYNRQKIFGNIPKDFQISFVHFVNLLFNSV